MKNYQVTEWYRHFLKLHIKPGDLCIDATAGNGHDTAYLAKLTGPGGEVLAFDIQKQAIARTGELLVREGLSGRVRLILDGHEHMAQYALPESVSCIVFNFGYLPGGDHALSTRPSTSIPAIQTGLSLLKKGGLMALCIYSGGDSGFAERDALLPFLQSLDPKRFLVIVSQYYNRPNHPPVPVLVVKL